SRGLDPSGDLCPSRGRDRDSGLAPSTASRYRLAGRVAVPTSVGPASAVRRHAAIGCVRRNAVVLIDVLHAAFHAADFAVVIRGLVALPAGVVAVKPFLIADREPNLRMSEMGQGERHE